MTLQELRTMSDSTIGDLHARIGEGVHPARGADGVAVTTRWIGDGWTLRWLDPTSGAEAQKTVRNEAEFWRCVQRLRTFGALPWRPRKTKTLTGIQPVREAV